MDSRSTAGERPLSAVLPLSRARWQPHPTAVSMLLGISALAITSGLQGLPRVNKDTPSQTPRHPILFILWDKSRLSGEKASTWPPKGRGRAPSYH